MEPKFIFPSPNFIKSEKAISLHYLTPCGMTLLTRGKQPPPMYGARGSTVPGKYIKLNTQQDVNKGIIISDIPTVCTKKCANCGMELATLQDMRRHLEQHEPCPADDCNFAALASKLEQHIEANHITGLYKTVRKAWTPEDIAAWRAERCQRFPTAANVEIAKQAAEQRVNRGERLEAFKARFGKREDRRRIRPQTNGLQDSKHAKARENRCKTTVGHRMPQKTGINPEKTGKICSEDFYMYVSTTTFRGTSKLTNYKHFKAKLASEQNALSNMLGMYGTDSEDEDDCEPEPTGKNNIITHKLPKYTTDELKSCMNDETEPHFQINDTELVDIKSSLVLKNGSVSSDEEPIELPIKRITDTELAPTVLQQKTLAIIGGKLKSNIETVKRPSLKKRHSGLNYKRARLISNQNTMLSKLLVSDVRHERNVLLQCVRFVCDQHFFDRRSLFPDSKNINIL